MTNTNKIRGKGKWLIVLTVLLAFVSLALPVMASVVGTPGNVGGSSSRVPANATLWFADGTRDIIGYRFSVYGEDGVKKGHAISILDSGAYDISGMYCYLYYNTDSGYYELPDKLALSAAEKNSDSTSKMTYSSELVFGKYTLNTSAKTYTMQYYNGNTLSNYAGGAPAYLTTGQVYRDDYATEFSQDFKWNGDWYTPDMSKFTYDPNIFFSKNSDGDPTGWFVQNSDGISPNAQKVKELCGVEESGEKCFVFAEPIIHGAIGGENYALTVTEWALYQCNAIRSWEQGTYGVNNYNGWSAGVPYAGNNDIDRTWYAWIARWVTTKYPYALYVTQEELAPHISDGHLTAEQGVFWGMANPMPQSWIKTDSDGSKYIAGTNGSRSGNVSQEIVETMMGVGMYYEALKDNGIRVTVETTVDGSRAVPFEMSHIQAIVKNASGVTTATEDHFQYMSSSSSSSVTFYVDRGSSVTVNSQPSSGSTMSTYTTVTNITEPTTITIPYYSLTTYGRDGITATKNDGQSSPSGSYLNKKVFRRGYTASIDCTVASGKSFGRWSVDYGNGPMNASSKSTTIGMYSTTRLVAEAASSSTLDVDIYVDGEKASAGKEYYVEINGIAQPATTQQHSSYSVNQNDTIKVYAASDSSNAADRELHLIGTFKIPYRDSSTLRLYYSTLNLTYDPDTIASVSGGGVYLCGWSNDALFGNMSTSQGVVVGNVIYLPSNDGHSAQSFDLWTKNDINGGYVVSFEVSGLAEGQTVEWYQQAPWAGYKAVTLHNGINFVTLGMSDDDQFHFGNDISYDVRSDTLCLSNFHIMQGSNALNASTSASYSATIKEGSTEPLAAEVIISLLRDGAPWSGQSVKIGDSAAVWNSTYSAYVGTAPAGSFDVYVNGKLAGTYINNNYKTTTYAFTDWTTAAYSAWLGVNAPSGWTSSTSYSGAISGTEIRHAKGKKTEDIHNDTLLLDIYVVPEIDSELSRQITLKVVAGTNIASVKIGSASATTSKSITCTQTRTLTGIKNGNGVNIGMPGDPVDAALLVAPYTCVYSSWSTCESHAINATPKSAVTSDYNYGNATINLTLDGSAWGGQTVALYSGSTLKYTASSTTTGVYTVTKAASGTYDVKVGGKLVGSVVVPKGTSKTTYTFSQWTVNSGNSPVSKTTASTSVKNHNQNTQLTASATAKTTDTAGSVTVSFAFKTLPNFEELANDSETITLQVKAGTNIASVKIDSRTAATSDTISCTRTRTKAYTKYYTTSAKTTVLGVPGDIVSADAYTISYPGSITYGTWSTAFPHNHNINATVKSSVAYNKGIAKVTVYKDGAAYASRDVDLYQSGAKKYDLTTYSNGVYSGTVTSGTYDVYVDGKDTNVNITVAAGTTTYKFEKWTVNSGNTPASTTTAATTVSHDQNTVLTASATASNANGSGAATVNYYTVTAVAGTYVSNAYVVTSSTSTATTTSVVVLSGTNVYFKSTKSSAAGYTYSNTISWAKNSGNVSAFTSTSGSVSAAKTITATTKMTASTTRSPSWYNIVYDLGGGSFTTPTWDPSDAAATPHLTNGTSKMADGTTLKQRFINPTKSTYVAYDDRYELWFRVEAPTKTGYEFAGWVITDTNGTGASWWSASQSKTCYITASPWTPADNDMALKTAIYQKLRNDTGTVTFTAQWTKVETESRTVTLKLIAGTNVASVKIDSRTAAAEDLITCTQTRTKKTAPDGTVTYGAWSTETHNINATVKSSATYTRGPVDITLKKDGAPWANQKIYLSHTSTSNDKSRSGVTDANGVCALDAVSTSLTYYIWTDLGYTGVTVKANAGTTTYKFSKWTVNEGNTPTSTTAAATAVSHNQNTTLTASATATDTQGTKVSVEVNYKTLPEFEALTNETETITLQVKAGTNIASVKIDSRTAVTSDTVSCTRTRTRAYTVYYTTSAMTTQLGVPGDIVPAGAYTVSYPGAITYGNWSTTFPHNHSINATVKSSVAYNKGVAKVTVKKDGASYADRDVDLYQSGTKKYDLTTYSGGVYSGTVNSGTYDVYVDGKDTNVNITVSDGTTSYKFEKWTVNSGNTPASATTASTTVSHDRNTVLTASATATNANGSGAATVNYYTVTAVAGTYVSNAYVLTSSTSTATTTSVVVLSGTKVYFKSTKSSATGYTYSNTISWAQNSGNIGAFTSTSGSASAAKTITATTKVTASTTREPSWYNIVYDLDGGSFATPTWDPTDASATPHLRNGTNKMADGTTPKQRFINPTKSTYVAYDDRYELWFLVEAPTKPNCVFAGWVITDTNGTGASWWSTPQSKTCYITASPWTPADNDMATKDAWYQKLRNDTGTVTFTALWTTIGTETRTVTLQLVAGTNIASVKIDSRTAAATDSITCTQSRTVTTAPDGTVTYGEWTTELHNINATVKSNAAYNYGVAKVTVKKDGTAYASRDVDLYKDGTKKYDLTTYSSGVYSGTVASGTYNIYVDGKNTGVTITVAAGTTTYKFSKWTVNSGNTPASTTVAATTVNHDQNTKLTASATATNTNGSGAATVNYKTLPEFPTLDDESETITLQVKAGTNIASVKIDSRTAATSDTISCTRTRTKTYTQYYTTSAKTTVLGVPGDVVLESAYTVDYPGSITYGTWSTTFPHNHSINATPKSTTAYNYGTVTVTVTKDGSAWGSQNVYLSTSSTTNSKTKTGATASTGKASFSSVATGTYYVWTDLGYTGQKVTVAAGTTTYAFSKWTVNSGDTPASTTTAATTVSHSQNTVLTASATAKNNPSSVTATVAYKTLPDFETLDNESESITLQVKAGTNIASVKIDSRTAASTDTATCIRTRTCAYTKYYTSSAMTTVLGVPGDVILASQYTVEYPGSITYGTWSTTFPHNHSINATPKSAATYSKGVAKVTVKKDGTAYADRDVDLYQSSTKQYDLTTYSNGVYSGTVNSGTYDVYVDGKDTNVNITVSAGTTTYAFEKWTVDSGNAPASTTTASTTVSHDKNTVLTASAKATNTNGSGAATVNYYTVTAVAGTYVSNAYVVTSSSSTATTTSVVVLSGTNVYFKSTKSSATGYTYSSTISWAQNSGNIGAFTSTSGSASAAKTITATTNMTASTTRTPSWYNIVYDLDGGSFTTPTWDPTDATATPHLTNGTSKMADGTTLKQRFINPTKSTYVAYDDKYELWFKVEAPTKPNCEFAGWVITNTNGSGASWWSTPQSKVCYITANPWMPADNDMATKSALYQKLRNDTGTVTFTALWTELGTETRTVTLQLVAGTNIASVKIDSRTAAATDSIVCTQSRTKTTAPDGTVTYGAWSTETHNINATVKSATAYNYGVAKVTVKKDGAAYASRDVDLYQSGTKKYDLTTYSSGVYSGTVASGTYNVYVDGKDTGVKITVSAGTTTYTFSKWTVNSGNEPTSTTVAATTVAHDQNTKLTASATATNTNGIGTATVNYKTLPALPALEDESEAITLKLIAGTNIASVKIDSRTAAASDEITCARTRTRTYTKYYTTSAKTVVLGVPGDVVLESAYTTQYPGSISYGAWDTTFPHNHSINATPASSIVYSRGDVKVTLTKDGAAWANQNVYLSQSKTENTKSKSGTTDANGVATISLVSANVTYYIWTDLGCTGATVVSNKGTTTYSFEKWTVNEGNTPASTTTASTTVSHNANTTLTATAVATNTPGTTKNVSVAYVTIASTSETQTIALTLKAGTNVSKVQIDSRTAATTDTISCTRTRNVVSYTYDGATYAVGDCVPSSMKSAIEGGTKNWGAWSVAFPHSHTIKATIPSNVTTNTVTVTLLAEGVAWSGQTVNLSTSNTTNTATYTATTNSSGIATFTASANGTSAKTYYVWVNGACQGSVSVAPAKVYKFSKWTVDEGNTPASTTTASTTVSHSQNTVLTASATLTTKEGPSIAIDFESREVILNLIAGTNVTSVKIGDRAAAATDSITCTQTRTKFTAADGTVTYSEWTTETHNINATVKSDVAYTRGDVIITLKKDDAAWANQNIYLSHTATENSKSQTGKTNADGVCTITAVSSNLTYYIWTDLGYSGVTVKSNAGTTTYAFEKWTVNEGNTPASTAIAATTVAHNANTTLTASAKATNHLGETKEVTVNYKMLPAFPALENESNTVKLTVKAGQYITQVNIGSTKNASEVTTSCTQTRTRAYTKYYTTSAKTIVLGVPGDVIPAGSYTVAYPGSITYGDWSLAFPHSHSIGATVKANETSNTVKVTLKMNGTAWSGQPVSLSTSNTTNTATYTATTNASGVATMTAASNGTAAKTYYVWVNGAVQGSVSVYPANVYAFDKWTVNSGNTPASATTASTTVSHDKDTVLTANGKVTTHSGSSLEVNLVSVLETETREVTLKLIAGTNITSVQIDTRTAATEDEITCTQTRTKATAPDGTVTYTEWTTETHNINATVKSNVTYTRGPVDITLKKDGAAWANQNIYLSHTSTSNDKSRSGVTDANGVCALDAVSTSLTYYIWTDLGYTGVTVRAKAGTTEYAFSKWTVNEGNAPASTTAASTTVSHNTDTTLTASATAKNIQGEKVSAEVNYKTLPAFPVLENEKETITLTVKVGENIKNVSLVNLSGTKVSNASSASTSCTRTRTRAYTKYYTSSAATTVLGVPGDIILASKYTASYPGSIVYGNWDVAFPHNHAIAATVKDTAEYPHGKVSVRVLAGTGTYSGLDVDLYQNGVKKYDLTLASGAYSATVASGTYDVYIGGKPVVDPVSGQYRVTVTSGTTTYTFDQWSTAEGNSPANAGSANTTVSHDRNTVLTAKATGADTLGSGTVTIAYMKLGVLPVGSDTETITLTLKAGEYIDTVRIDSRTAAATDTVTATRIRTRTMTGWYYTVGGEEIYAGVPGDYVLTNIQRVAYPGGEVIGEWDVIFPHDHAILAKPMVQDGTNTVNVTVTKDGTAWTGRNVYLSTSSTSNTKTATAVSGTNGVATFTSVRVGTYYVWTDLGITDIGAVTVQPSATYSFKEWIVDSGDAPAKVNNASTTVTHSHDTVLTAVGRAVTVGPVNVTVAYKTLPAFPILADETKSITLDVIAGDYIKSVTPATTKTCTQSRTRVYTMYYTTSARTTNLGVPGDIVLASTYTVTYPGSITYGSWTPASHKDSITATPKSDVLTNTVKIKIQLDNAGYSGRNVVLKPVTGGTAITNPVYSSDGTYTFTNVSAGTSPSGYVEYEIYIDGVKQSSTVKVYPAETYKFDKWTVNSGNAPASLVAASTTVAHTVNTKLTASATRTTHAPSTAAFNFYTLTVKTRVDGVVTDPYDDVDELRVNDEITSGDTYTVILPEGDPYVIGVLPTEDSDEYKDVISKVITEPTTEYVDYYTLTIVKGEGVDDVIGEGTYFEGTEVDIGATTEDGYRKPTWTTEEGNEPADPSKSETTVTITEKTVLVVEAEPNTVTIHVELDDEDYTDYPGTIVIRDEDGNEIPVYPKNDGDNSELVTEDPVPNGTWTVIIDGEETEIKIVVNDNDPEVTVDYYTLTVKTRVDDVVTDPFTGNEVKINDTPKSGPSSEIILRKGEEYKIDVKEFDDSTDYTEYKSGTITGPTTVYVDYYTVTLDTTLNGDEVDGYGTLTINGKDYPTADGSVTKTVLGGSDYKVSGKNTSLDTTKPYTKSGTVTSKTNETIRYYSVTVNTLLDDAAVDGYGTLTVGGNTYPTSGGTYTINVREGTSYSIDAKNSAADTTYPYKAKSGTVNAPVEETIKYYTLTVTTRVNGTVTEKLNSSQTTPFGSVTVGGNTSVCSGGTTSVVVREGYAYTVSALKSSADTARTTYTTGTITGKATVYVDYYTVDLKSGYYVSGVGSTVGSSTVSGATTTMAVQKGQNVIITATNVAGNTTINGQTYPKSKFVAWYSISGGNRSAQFSTSKSYTITGIDKAYTLIADAQAPYAANYYVQNKNGAYVLFDYEVKYTSNNLLGTAIGSKFPADPMQATVAPQTTITSRLATYFKAKETKTAYKTGSVGTTLTMNGCVSVGIDVPNDGKAHVDYYYDRAEVKITYVLNGGTYGGSTANVTRTYPVGTDITLIDPTAPTGKEFGGWYLHQNGDEFSGCIGVGNSSYLLMEDTIVYACWFGDSDIGITANTIYGTIRTGGENQFMSSATVINHSRRDVIPSNHVDAIVTVRQGSTVIGTYKVTDICVPALKTNLLSVAIPSGTWSTSATYSVEWKLDFSRSNLFDSISINNKSTIVNITPDTASAFSNPARPDYSIDRDPAYNASAAHSNTSVNTYTWQVWTYENGAFKLNTYTDKLDVTLILKPENENGLRSYTLGVDNLHNYRTRSGYGFSIHSIYDDLSLTPQRSNVRMNATVGQLNVKMLYPEFNYSTESGKYTSISSVSSNGSYLLTMPIYSDYESNDVNDKYAHYTPMWMPDGLYQPLTVFGGMWSPVGEVTASVLQGELTTKTLMDRYGVYTNTYTIEGSLYDDLYVN